MEPLPICTRYSLELVDGNPQPIPFQITVAANTAQLSSVAGTMQAVAMQELVLPAIQADTDDDEGAGNPTTANLVLMLCDCAAHPSITVIETSAETVPDHALDLPPYHASKRILTFRAMANILTRRLRLPLLSPRARLNTGGRL